MAEVSSNPTADEHRKKIAEEYGQWVATEPIYIDGVLAFNTDNPVPVGHVKTYELDKKDLVRSTKAAAKDTKSS